MQIGLTLCLCALAFGLGVVLEGRRGDGPRPEGVAASPPGTLWPDPKAVAPFELEDQAGEAFGLERLRGRWSFLFFGYTHCPDVCPLTMGLMNQVWQDLPTRHPDKTLQMIFVTLDPMRDDRQTLHDYLHYFNSEFIGLGGELEAVLSFSKQLGIPYGYSPAGEGDDYHVDHPASLFLLDEQARLVGILHAPHQVDAIMSGFDAISRFIGAQDVVAAGEGRPVAMSAVAGAPRSGVHQQRPARSAARDGAAGEDVQHSPLPLEFSNAWINEPPPGASVAAGYLTIFNHSAAVLQLLAAESNDFAAVELHENVVANNVNRMRRVAHITIPAAGEVALLPGGYHLMFKAPTRAIRVGDRVQLVLHFSDGIRSELHLSVRHHDETAYHHGAHH